MIGIITAMASEASALTDLMENKTTTKKAGCLFTTGTLQEKETVICQGGVGKALAAMATTLTILEYKPTLVLNCGVAGGLKEGQKPLDLIVAEEVIQADFDTSPLDGPEGLGKRFKTRVPEIPCTTGIIASQDLFMEREEDIRRVETLFPEATVAEMEAGAIAQVCDAFEIPYICIRSLSDVVRHHDNHMEFNEFARKAADKSAEFVKALFETL